MRLTLLLLVVLLSCNQNKSNQNVYFYLDANSCINCTIAAERILETLASVDTLFDQISFYLLFPRKDFPPESFVDFKQRYDKHDITLSSDRKLIEKLTTQYDILAKNEFFLLEQHDEISYHWEYGRPLLLSDLKSSLIKLRE